MIFNRTSNYEKLIPSMFLAAAAGGLDAYSYLLHGEVFAGLQTGNLILFGINLAKGNLDRIGRYIFGVSMFILGVVILRFIQHFYDKKHKISRQSLVVWYEILLLTVVMFISPFASNLAILAILSMAAAAQLQEFRRLKGSTYTSLMMTGNLRTVTEGFYDGIIHQDRDALKRAFLFISIILGFISGVILTAFFISYLNRFAIIISIILLLIAMFISHFKTK